MASKFSRWLKRVRETQEEEINCSACLEQISHYVDRELESGDAAQRLPLIKHHLDQCQVCSEEYQLLRDLARQEMDHTLPSVEELSDRLQRRRP